MFNIISKFQNDEDKEVDINNEINYEDKEVDEIKQVDEIKEEENQEMKNDDELLKQKLNESDSDEDNENVMYVISIDNVPYYYHKDLVSVRKNMWKLAHQYIISDEDDEIGVSNDKYIMTNNPNNIQIISPLDFLFFRYSNVLHVLKIDYILPF